MAICAGVEWKPNDVFYVHLEKEKEEEGKESKTELGKCKIAEIAYLQADDEPKLQFVKNHAVHLSFYISNKQNFSLTDVRRVGGYLPSDGASHGWF